MSPHLKFFRFILTQVPCSSLPSDILINFNRFNFLDKSVGISSLFEINNSALVDHIPEIVETQQPLLVPGMEGLLIPYKTRGHVLKVVGGNTVLVRWEVNGWISIIILFVPAFFCFGACGIHCQQKFHSWIMYRWPWCHDLLRFNPSLLWVVQFSISKWWCIKWCIVFVFHFCVCAS